MLYVHFYCDLFYFILLKILNNGNEKSVKILEILLTYFRIFQLNKYKLLRYVTLIFGKKICPL